MHQCLFDHSHRSPSFSETSQIPIEGEAAFLASWEADIVRAARRGVILKVSSSSTADDVAQDVRMRLCRAFRTVKPSEGYVRRVIQNAVSNSTRRMGRAIIFTADEFSPLSRELKVEPPSVMIQSVQFWVAELPTRFLQLYQLLYVEGASQREAARRMRLSQPRVAQLHQQLLEGARRDLATLAA